jgi:hypothetical protein
MIGLCAVVVGMFFLTRVTSGEGTEIQARPGDRSLFGDNRAPRVEPPIADPFAAGRNAAAARDRAGINPSQRARYDAAVATSTRFSVAYASWNTEVSADSYVEGLPYVSAGLRAKLLLEAKERWPVAQRDRTVAAARASSIPPLMTVFGEKTAQAQVQVIQDISAVSGQQTVALSYRVDLEWDPAAPVRPELLPSPPPSRGASGSGSPTAEGGPPEPEPSLPSPSASGPTGAWQVVGVLQL